VFKTKPQLAQDILTDMIADQTMPPRVAGDGVYGRAGKLRTFLQDNQIGYVLRIGSAFTTEMTSGPSLHRPAAAPGAGHGRARRRAVTAAHAKPEPLDGSCPPPPTTPISTDMTRPTSEAAVLGPK
jgi:SRSO17 transposase